MHIMWRSDGKRAADRFQESRRRGERRANGLRMLPLPERAGETSPPEAPDIGQCEMGVSRPNYGGTAKQGFVH